MTRREYPNRGWRVVEPKKNKKRGLNRVRDSTLTSPIKAPGVKQGPSGPNKTAARNRKTSSGRLIDGLLRGSENKRMPPVIGRICLRISASGSQTDCAGRAGFADPVRKGVDRRGKASPARSTRKHTPSARAANPYSRALLTSDCGDYCRIKAKRGGKPNAQAGRVCVGLYPPQGTEYFPA